MNDNLIRINSYTGELKLSIKRGGMGYTVTTKEIVLQVPHQTYHVMHEDIISIVPYQINHLRQSDETMIYGIGCTARYYSVETDKSYVYNRSGIFTRGPMKYIVELTNEFLDYVSRHSGLVGIETNAM